MENNTAKKAKVVKVKQVPQNPPTQHPYFKENFKAFCLGEFSYEKIHILETIQEYNKLFTIEEKLEKAKSIIIDFLEKDALFEVQVDSKIIEEIKQLVQQVKLDENIFEKLRIEIENELKPVYSDFCLKYPQKLTRPMSPNSLTKIRDNSVKKPSISNILSNSFNFVSKRRQSLSQKEKKVSPEKERNSSVVHFIEHMFQTKQKSPASPSFQLFKSKTKDQEKTEKIEKEKEQKPEKKKRTREKAPEIIYNFDYNIAESIEKSLDDEQQNLEDKEITLPRKKSNTKPDIYDDFDDEVSMKNVLSENTFGLTTPRMSNNVHSDNTLSFQSDDELSIFEEEDHPQILQYLGAPIN
eukprot:gene9759-2086_t